jgi:hypothetical protein
MNLLELFNRTKTEEKDISLYCQNPQCGSPLISPDEESIANMKGNLVHSKCIMEYMAYQTFQSSSGIMLFSSIPSVSYINAKRLAKKNAVKFNKLETGATN